MSSKKFYTNIQTFGKHVLVRGYRDGEPFKEKIEYKPYYFVKSKNKTASSEYKNLNGDPLVRLDFETMNDAYEFIKKYDGMASNFPIYGYKRQLYNYISDTFSDQEPVLDAVSVVYFDIEVAGNHYEPVHVVQLEDNTVTTIGELRFYDENIRIYDEAKSAYVERNKSSYLKPNGFPYSDQAKNPITAISIRKNDQIYVLSTVAYETHREDVIAIICKDEKQLLLEFIKLWKELAPDIISGYNCEFFDVPYVVNRLKKVFGDQAAKQLSPWGMIKEYTTVTKFGKEQSSYRLIGISCIDLMAAYIKFSFKNHESFTLNYIAHVELNEKKIDYSEFDSLYDLYLKDPQKFIEYNIQDTDLVYRLNAKTGLIPQVMELAYSAGVNYEDAFTSVLFWEVKIKNKLAKEGIQIPANVEHKDKPRKNVGAYVKPPRPAKYKWVVGLDLDSLYPSLMMQYNISPETLVSCHKELMHLMPIEDILAGKLLDNELIRKNIKEKNYGYTPNGAFFDNNKRGFLSKMMDEEYALRKTYKKKMLSAKDKLNHVKEEIARRNKINNG